MQRIELHLEDDVVKALQTLADTDKRSRKQYAELVIIKHVKEHEEKNLIKRNNYG